MDYANSTVVNVNLIMVAGRPRTPDGYVGCVMLHVTGNDEDSQWFDFRPSFYSEPVRVQWDNGTMEALLPEDIADSLIRRGYARQMTTSEAEAHNARLLEEGESYLKKGE